MGEDAPGIGEAVEQREPELVEPRMERFARMLERVAELPGQATGGTVPQKGWMARRLARDETFNALPVVAKGCNPTTSGI